MRTIIIGFGTVGGAFAQILHEKRNELLETFGFRPTLVSVIDIKGAVVNPSGVNVDELRKSQCECGSIALHPDFEPGVGGVEVIERVDADVVVEATPSNIETGEPGLSHIMAALRYKKHVITTNKGALAIAFPALLELASYNKVSLRFSGTVGGGTPILDFGRKCLAGSRILSIKGILNGTTNYVLSRMDECGLSMDAALKEAQQKGYAETDPSYDLMGIDSASKLVIMANWLMGKSVTIRDVDVSGITEVSIDEVQEAKNKDCAVKLIAYLDDKTMWVKPQLIPRRHPLCVGGVLNAVSFRTEYAHEVTIVGRGAGGIETGEAILRDLIEIRRSAYNSTR